MSLIEWQDEFSVGVAAVDHEHREMVDLINELYDSLMQQGNEEMVEQFLGEIYAKISAHFALEEHVMREREYDKFAEHKADHERLLDEIRDLMDGYEAEHGFDKEAFARSLRSWFTGHFKEQDARLHGRLG